MQIVTDSSVMLSTAEGRERGLVVLPLSVSVSGKTWLEYDEISPEDFMNLVRQGDVPTSSSPPAGLTINAYDTDEEVIHITMADGLSGSYEVACGLQPQAKHPERVHILNSRTLCVPHRVLVYHARNLAKEGHKPHDILDKLKGMVDSAHSYLIPEDFDFLRRGGRLTPLAAKVVTMIKAVPVMEQTPDGKRLERFTITRAFEKAIHAIIEDLKKRKINDNFYIGISHADNTPHATKAGDMIAKAFPRCRQGIFGLSPAFITQGGPGCVAIQAIDIRSCPGIELS
ncbi:MAG: DegV family protein [Raoultibacter sp.]|jgi:DegV family protein with EDD domain